MRKTETESGHVEKCLQPTGHSGGAETMTNKPSKLLKTKHSDEARYQQTWGVFENKGVIGIRYLISQ